MSDPDMSYLCRGWTPTQAYPATVATLPRGRDLTLSVICENVARNPYPIRILTARAEGIDLWAIDLLISGELLVGEYRKPPKVLPALGGDRLQISLSYSPTSGGFALCANAMNGEEGVSMSASNVGRLLPLPATYELVIGADNMAPFSEVPPLGWVITAQHDLARPIVDGEPAEDWRLREGPLPSGFIADLSEEQRALLNDLFLGYDPDKERVVSRGPGRILVAPLANDAMTSRAASALVQTNPRETLELALNSIEHWLKVARSAIEEVP